MNTKTHLMTGVTISAALLLQGCSVMRTLGLVNRKPKVEQAYMTPAQPPAIGYTETGRQQITDGNYGRAMETFQQALAQGEPAAPALNGLGVAYANVGRIDLAAEYFRQAMAADPATGKYASNLALLLKTHSYDEALPRQTLAPLEVLPVIAPDTPTPRVTQADGQPRAQATARPEVLAAEQPIRGQLTQIAPREYAIRVASGRRVSGEEMARLERTFRPIVRIELQQKTDKPEVRR